MIRIVPAIDIINGKCVRLSQGDYSKRKSYSTNPLELAKELQDAGCKRLHLVDLDGAISHHIINYKILESIASSTSLTIDFGGGIKTDEDAKIAFNSGASMITGGSVAVKNPILFQEWISKYGSNKIILGADTNNGKIAINGWTNDSEHDVVEFINNYQKLGIKTVISTDVQSDGMLKGPSINLYQRILDNSIGIELVASGGIRNLDDLHNLDIISELNIRTHTDNPSYIKEAIVGKALFEGYITMNQLSDYNSNF